MGRYAVKRLLWLIPVLFLISFVTFFLMYLSPGDPARIFLSQGGDVPTAEAVAELSEKLGLDKPVWEQYGSWLVNVLHGNLETSIFTGNPVIQEITTYFPNTLRLTVLGIFLTRMISIPVGIFLAVRENGILDHLIRGICFLFGSLLGFFAAFLLIYVLGVKLRWLPTVSSGSPRGIWIPALTLMLTLSPGYIRQIRGAVLQELEEPYVRMARARGIRERLILYRGVLRSVGPSLITIVGMGVGRLLGGTAIIEIVCTYQGLGRLAVNSITNRDYPLMQGFVLAMAVIYVLVNLITDLLHAWADPRIRQKLTEENRKRGTNEKEKKAV